MISFPHEPTEVRMIGPNFLVVYNRDKLSETSRPKGSQNVEFFNESGKKMWTVNGMDECKFWRNYDTFVGTRIKEGKIQLIAFSGNVYDVDLRNGKVTYADFTK